MPKNKKSGGAGSGGRRASEALAMRSLVCGCVAEIFLLIVRRYANGTMNQVIMWNERYLPILAGVGVALLAIGAIWIGVQRGNQFQRTVGAYVAGAGIFVAASSLLSIRNLTFLDYLIVVVPAAAFLGIVWGLYERECAMSLTALELLRHGSFPVLCNRFPLTCPCPERWLSFCLRRWLSWSTFCGTGR